ncbi:MAG: hypothetical protein FWC27_05285 [Firmicutes bacterium]|nr:hypothetical protein [Bacillota bacterium]
MRKMLATLLCLTFLGLFACGTPTSNATDESTAATTIAVETTVPPQEKEAFAFAPAYAVNSAYFFAVLDDGELYIAPLDASRRPRRIPLPLRYKGESFEWEPQPHMEAQRFDTRICETAEDTGRKKPSCSSWPCRLF